MIVINERQEKTEELLKEVTEALKTMVKYMKHPGIQEAGKDMDVPPKLALNWLERLLRSARALEARE